MLLSVHRNPLNLRTLQLRHAFRFQLAYKGLQRIHNMGTDIAADKHQHDIIANRQLALIQPGLYIINARHMLGLGHGGFHLGRIVGKMHARHRLCIGLARANLSLRRPAHNAVMRKIHADLIGVRILFRLV